MYHENPLENPCTDYQSERHAEHRREYQELLDAEAFGDFLCQWADQSAHVWAYQDHLEAVEEQRQEEYARTAARAHVKAYWEAWRSRGCAYRAAKRVLRKLEDSTLSWLRSCDLPHATC